MPDFNDLILRFFRDDIGGILITGEAGGILYSDARSEFLRTEKSNWSVACPQPAEGQKAEAWDLTCSGGRTFIVLTSTLCCDGRFIPYKEQLYALIIIHIGHPFCINSAAALKASIYIITICRQWLRLK